MKTILVTGANGFIGSHLVEILLKKAFRVRCLVRKTSDLTWLQGLNVEYVLGELIDPPSLETAVAETDWIFHLAGKIKASSKDEFYRANATGTENLLRAVVKVNPGLRRFVYVSSLAAAGPSLDGRPIMESDPARPVTWYGRSKLEGERIAMRFADRIPLAIVRPPIVFGPRDTDVLHFFRTIRNGVLPMIGWKGHSTGFVYVDDLIQGLVLTAEKEAAVGQTYYFVNNGSLSWKDFGKMAAKALERKAIPLPIPLCVLVAALLLNEGIARLKKKPTILNMQKLPEYREPFWCCDGSKAEKELGFRPTYSMEEAVTKTISWYRDKGWL